jgi:long-subunit acyl-CoA synthetase (AMP-forming)
MTETTGATCVTSANDLSLGHVGGPFPCCEVRVVPCVCVCVSMCV